MPTLRETPLMRVEKSTRGIRVTSKESSVYPRSKAVSQQDWEYLRGLEDGLFHAACVIDFHVGIYKIQ